MIDGVIKYEIEHTSKNSPDFSDYEKIEALRARLFCLGLIGEKDGVGFGNLSLRGKKEKTFHITATQTGAQSTLLAQHYTYIYDYDFSTFKVFSQGLHQPSSEALSHAMIYEINPKINAVIHIHSKHLWNFMKEENFLSTKAEYGTLEMVEEIASLYENKNPFEKNIFVMRGHEDGIISFGRDIQEAELVLYKLYQSSLKDEWNN